MYVCVSVRERKKIRCIRCYYCTINHLFDRSIVLFFICSFFFTVNQLVYIFIPSYRFLERDMKPLKHLYDLYIHLYSLLSSSLLRIIKFPRKKLEGDKKKRKRRDVINTRGTPRERVVR